MFWPSDWSLRGHRLESMCTVGPDGNSRFNHLFKTQQLERNTHMTTPTTIGLPLARGFKPTCYARLDSGKSVIAQIVTANETTISQPGHVLYVYLCVHWIGVKYVLGRAGGLISP